MINTPRKSKIVTFEQQRTRTINMRGQRNNVWKCPECEQQITLHVKVTYPPTCYNGKSHSSQICEMVEVNSSNDKDLKTNNPCICGGQLVHRIGRFGPFLGCTSYPKCRKSESIDKTQILKPTTPNRH